MLSSQHRFCDFILSDEGTEPVNLDLLEEEMHDQYRQWEERRQNLEDKREKVSGNVFCLTQLHLQQTFESMSLIFSCVCEWECILVTQEISECKLVELKRSEERELRRKEKQQELEAEETEIQQIQKVGDGSDGSVKLSSCAKVSMLKFRGFFFLFQRKRMRNLDAKLSSCLKR